MHAYVNALDSTSPRYQGSVPVQDKRRDMCAGMVVAGCPTSFSDMPLQSYQVTRPASSHSHDQNACQMEMRALTTCCCTQRDVQQTMPSLK